MALTVERLSARDFDEAVDFLNLVFSQASRPHDFEALLPKLYRRDDEHMACNIACRRDGRIRAIVGTFPMETEVAGYTLRVTGIGSVSTHLSERGGGMMHTLMSRAVSDMLSDGTDISCLGGNRRRYQNYGYERAGTRYRYELIRRNVVQNGLDGPAAGIRFEPIGERDTERLDTARALYESRPFHVRRGEGAEFHLSLREWTMTPYAALDPDGRMVGYLTASADRQNLTEFFALTPELLLAMLGAWLLQNRLDGLSLPLTPWEPETARTLGRVCESFDLGCAYSYKIVRWENAVRALFALRARLAPLPDGELVLGIREWGNLALRAKSGSAECARTQRPADLELPALDATRLLFGPLPPAFTAPLPGRLAPLLAAWLPLPLSWYRQDCV